MGPDSLGGSATTCGSARCYSPLTENAVVR